MNRKYARERDLGEECVRCGAQPGENCVNYRGKRKAPCHVEERGRTNAGTVQAPAPKQRLLWEEGEMANGQL